MPQQGARLVGRVAARGVPGRIRSGRSPDARHVPYLELARAGARASGVPEALVMAVIEVESAFDPAAVSRAGAIGLMQLMPRTAAAWGAPDPYDAERNVAAGSAYLAHLLARYGGDVALALAAYNAGPGRVDAAGRPPFSDTYRYIRLVTEARARWGHRIAAIEGAQ